MTDQPSPDPAPGSAPDDLPAMTPVARVEGALTPTPPAAARPKASRGRWVVALVATLLVVIVAGAIAAIAGSAGAKAVAPAYLPADTILYADLRLDLPGDQRQQLGTLLAKFPGFADQANLDQKLDEALDRLVKRATNDRYSYTGNVSRWFGGQLALGAWSEGTSASGPGFLLIASVSDRSKLPTQLDSASQDLARELGVTVTVEDHNGTSIITLSGGTAHLPVQNAAFAITEDAVIVARDAKTVAAALDRKAGKSPNLAGESGFNQALGGLNADRLGTLYVDGAALGELLQSLPGASPAVGSPLPALPQTIVAELRVESGNVVARSRATLAAPSASASAAPTARTSDVASHVPGDAALYAEVHDVGSAWQQLLARAQGQPGFEQVAPQLKTLEAVLGTPLASYLDWAKDAALVVTLRNSGAHGGLVATTTDAAAGQARLTQLTTLLRLAEGQAGGAVSVTEQPYAGTTITTVTLDLSALPSLAGLPSLPAVGPSASAAPQASAGGTRVSLSYAFKDDVFVLGLDEAFVKAVLDVGADSSLAKQARYTEAVAAAGGPSATAILYADLTAWRTFLESKLPASQKAAYESDVKPYLVPLDRLVAVGTIDQDVRQGTLIIFTTQ